jgi:hypothetical protein
LVTGVPNRTRRLTVRERNLSSAVISPWSSRNDNAEADEETAGQFVEKRWKALNSTRTPNRMQHPRAIHGTGKSRTREYDLSVDCMRLELALTVKTITREMSQASSNKTSNTKITEREFHAYLLQLVAPKEVKVWIHRNGPCSSLEQRTTSLAVQ